jgi:hypothetical protein
MSSSLMNTFEYIQMYVRPILLVKGESAARKNKSARRHAVSGVC